MKKYIETIGELTSRHGWFNTLWGRFPFRTVNLSSVVRIVLRR